MTQFYVGTYTAELREEGIFLFDFDEATGRATLREGYAAGPNPSFLAVNRAGDVLYTVNETEDGAVAALRRDAATGTLTYLNSEPAHGAATCFVGFDADERHVLVANYNGGTAAALPIDARGALKPASDIIDHRNGPVRPRRDTPVHPHKIAPTPDGRRIVVTDLGLDATMLYEFANGRFWLADGGVALAAVGAGPRHFAFSPNGRTAYVINELNSTLDVFDYVDATLLHRQTVSSLPADFKGENSCAEVVVSADGRFVYGSNRGHDSIAIWPVDRITGDVGAASFVASGGACPRNFAISPSGRWVVVANQDSDNLVTFSRDQEYGGLERSGDPVRIQSPVCIVFRDDVAAT